MISVENLTKSDNLFLYSDPIKAQKKVTEYLGKNYVLYKSKNKNKKYSIIDPNGKVVNFGQLGYKDFTKTNDEKKRDNYLKRSANIKGDWKNNKYSPNNLSRRILW